jgi:excisionase family DNA binding protein
MSQMPTKLLTCRDAAEICQVTPRTIAKWCREGILTAQKVGKSWRIPRKGNEFLLMP